MTRHTSAGTAALLENRRVAAREAAVQLGWLTECPHHGEPFRTASAVVNTSEAAATIPADVIAAMTEVCATYADRCPYCARKSAVAE